MNGVDIDVGEEGRLQITASAYGGDTRVVYELSGVASCVVSVLANAVSPEACAGERPDPTLRDIQVDLGGVEERIRTIERPRAEGPRLEDAEIIVSGGRGLSAPADFELVEQLAKALGGMAGASRPLVDDGWVDSSRQVGLTGKITRPALYVAAGISGASQHMAGCSAAKTIVAINRDPDAAIFRYARYGIVGDCLEILPELIRAAKAR
jgi:electron transfer flavoprotein alpha subunit